MPNSQIVLLPAGIPWLINTYKQYVLMRERLLNDTQQLRTKLQHSIPESSFPGMFTEGSTMLTYAQSAISLFNPGGEQIKC